MDEISFRRCGVDLDNLIIKLYCIVDDSMKKIIKHRLRERGPNPLMSDSEVLTIEAIGEFCGFDQDKALFNHFRRFYAHFFPALKKINRTTFIRQMANLKCISEKLWQYVLKDIDYDPTLSIVDSFPMAVCYFARAQRCRRFKGEAAFGKDRLIRQTFYGFRVHVHLSWPGVITSFVLSPANIDEKEIVWGLTEARAGLKLGDRNYWAPLLKAEMAEENITLEAPYKHASSDYQPKRSYLINHFRYCIETVFSQLTRRYEIKKVWAKDMWHLCCRLLRKMLSHTLCFLINQHQGNSPLQLSKLLC